jgi:hypothetical protein
MPTPLIPLRDIRRPDVEVPRRRRLASRPIPAPARAPVPSRTARVKLKREISVILKKVAAATRSFYEVGAQLNTWKKTQSWRALSEGGDFKSFVAAHVMPYSTAARLLSVAEMYPKSVAVKLGIEKAFQLGRYAKLTNATALSLVQRDAGLGSPPRKVSELSAKEIKGLVAGLMMSSARSAVPKVTRADKQLARVFAQRFTEELGVDLDVRVDKKRNKLCLELDLDQARGAI